MSSTIQNCHCVAVLWSTHFQNGRRSMSTAILSFIAFTLSTIQIDVVHPNFCYGGTIWICPDWYFLVCVSLSNWHRDKWNTCQLTFVKFILMCHSQSPVYTYIYIYGGVYILWFVVWLYCGDHSRIPLIWHPRDKAGARLSNIPAYQTVPILF